MAEIVADNDLTARAEKVISLSKQIIGEDKEIFVTADDIATGNPRLNIAFVATLYNLKQQIKIEAKEKLSEVVKQKEVLQTKVETLLHTIGGKDQYPEFDSTITWRDSYKFKVLI